MFMRLHRYQDLLWSVDVSVRGGPPQRFLVDTAAGLTVLDSLTAQNLGLSPWGRLTGHKMGGQRVDFQQVDPVPLSLGGLVLKLDALAVLDLGKLLPPDWPPVAGVLALDAFEKQPVTFDFQRSALVLETPGSLERRSATARPLRVRVGRQAQGAAIDLFVRVGREAERPAWLELDSGNTGPTLLATHSLPLLGVTGEGGRAELDFGKDWSESIDWTHADLIIDGNLGQSFLNRHALTVDLPSCQAWLGRSDDALA